ncbi:MAG: ABC transporter substrate-binding protein [Thermomicrobiales bacterium]
MTSRSLVLLLLVLGLLSPPFAPSAIAQTPVPRGATPTPALPATIDDVDGVAVEITDISRIIPLNGNVAETIYALGLSANIVATDLSALYPPEVIDLPKIGYQSQLSVESILSYEPTLVMGAEDAGPPEAIDQLRNAGVTVLILPQSNSAEGAVAEIRAIGTALGVPAAGDAIATNVEQTIGEAQALSASIEPRARVAFLYVRGAGTQLIAGSNNQADAVVSAAGAINVGAEIGIQGYKPITPEALVQAAPDIILVLQMGLETTGGLDALLAIPGVAQTPAAESGNIVAFDDLYLLGFGPRIGDAIYDLTLAFYPEIKLPSKHPEWQGTS